MLADMASLIGVKGGIPKVLQVYSLLVNLKHESTGRGKKDDSNYQLSRSTQSLKKTTS